MKQPSRWVVFLIALALWGLSPMNAGARELPVIRIGILRDGPAVRFPETRAILQEEILALTTAEFDVRFPPAAHRDGNWEPARIRAALDGLLADPQVDIVVTLGAIASNEALRRGPLPKPVIAAAVIDAKLQNLPRRNDGSGVRNLAYIDAFKSFERDIRAFHELTGLRHLGVLVDHLLLAEFPRLQSAAEDLGRQLGARITLQPVTADPEAALALLPRDVDAVYITPLLRFPPEAFQLMTAELNRRRLPSFSMWGRDEVALGVFASLAPSTDFERLARRIALNIQRILLGEAPEDLPVSFAAGRRLSINMATARAIDRSPGWYLRTEADLIHDDPQEGGHRLTLKSAIDEALSANLELAAAGRAVSAGEASVDEARSSLLPQLGRRQPGGRDRRGPRRGQFRPTARARLAGHGQPEPAALLRGGLGRLRHPAAFAGGPGPGTRRPPAGRRPGNRRGLPQPAAGRELRPHSAGQPALDARQPRTRPGAALHRDVRPLRGFPLGKRHRHQPQKRPGGPGNRPPGDAAAQPPAAPAAGGCHQRRRNRPGRPPAADRRPANAALDGQPPRLRSFAGPVGARRPEGFPRTSTAWISSSPPSSAPWWPPNAPTGCPPSSCRAASARPLRHPAPVRKAPSSRCCRSCRP